MADGLFLMQRYLGSDDDEEENSNDIDKRSNELLENEEVEVKQTNKKKHKRSTSDFQEEKGDNSDPLLEVERDFEEIQENIVKSPKKKRLKLENNSEVQQENVVKSPKNNKLNPENNKNDSEDQLENVKSPKKNKLKIENHKNNREDQSESSKSPKKKQLKPENDKKDTEDQPLKEKKSKVKKNTEASQERKDSITTKEKIFTPIGQVKVPTKTAKTSSLPKWMSNPTVFEASLHNIKDIPLSELDYLDDATKAKLIKSKIESLFPVQAAVIPWLKESMMSNLRCLYRPSDLCVSAPTGSGKTLAFVLPIIDALKDRVVCAVRALVVLPVNELASQVFNVFKTYTQGTNLKVAFLSGKKSFHVEQKFLVATGIDGTHSCVDIVVTTPGRVLDHINKTEGFSLEHLQYLVIDEADRMMQDIQQGWLKRIEEAVFKTSNLSSCVCSALVGKRMPYVPVTVCQTMYVNEPLQKLLFSATLFHDPERLHALSLYKPKLFTAQATSDEALKNPNPSQTVGKCTIPDNLDLICVTCTGEAKPMALCHFIKDRQFKKVLCFTESVERARRLSLILEHMGVLRAREMSSNNTAVQRKITLEQFGAGKVDVIICSDIVARGMDIQDVDCVISYDVPKFVEAFVHRIGRTARAGKAGTAVALLSNDEISKFKNILKTAEIPYPEEVSVEDASLEQYVEAFKSALSAADAVIRKIKSGRAQSKPWKRLGKKTQISDVNRIPIQKPKTAASN